MKDMTGDELEVLKYTSNRLLSIEPPNHDKLNAEFRKKIESKYDEIFHEYETATIDHIQDIIVILKRINQDAWMKSTVTGTTVSVATEVKYYEEILKEAMK